MANNTVNLLASIESVTLNSTIESHQGEDGTTAEDPLKVLTQTARVDRTWKDVGISATITLWLDTEAHGVDEIKLAYFLPTVDGAFEWVTTASPTDDDQSNTIVWAANWPFIIVAPGTSDKLQTYAAYVAFDALAGTLTDVVRFRFINLDTAKAGRVETAIFK